MEVQKLMGSSDVDRTFVLAQNNMFSQESTPYNKSVVSAEKEAKVSKTAIKLNSVSSGSFLKCKEDLAKLSSVKIENNFDASSSQSTESLHKHNSGDGNARDYLEDDLMCEETLVKDKNSKNMPLLVI